MSAKLWGHILNGRLQFEFLQKYKSCKWEKNGKYSDQPQKRVSY